MSVTSKNLVDSGFKPDDFAVPADVSNLQQQIDDLKQGGTVGADGITYDWLTGTTAPASGLGKQGDMYLDTITQDVYKKTSGTVWTFQCNIKGAPGTGGGGGGDSFPKVYDMYSRDAFRAFQIDVPTINSRDELTGKIFFIRNVSSAETPIQYVNLTVNDFPQSHAVLYFNSAGHINNPEYLTDITFWHDMIGVFYFTDNFAYMLNAPIFTSEESNRVRFLFGDEMLFERIMMLFGDEMRFQQLMQLLDQM